MVDQIDAPPDMLQAARFLVRAALLPSEQARVEAQLRRLGEAPAARELVQAAEADPEWAELLEALGPRILELYMASRGAAPSVPKISPKEEVSFVRINLLVVLLGLVLAGALVYFAVTGGGGGQTQVAASNDLPVYTLDGPKSSKMVPVGIGIFR
mmetsp:Transcript_17855/g.62671  ORF Transcript_17855/g.62671 Transcript_17855/m.62671 type:complete len:155 (-) Transcript_17855:19-483(-)